MTSIREKKHFSCFYVMNKMFLNTLSKSLPSIISYQRVDLRFSFKYILLLIFHTWRFTCQFIVSSSIFSTLSLFSFKAAVVRLRYSTSHRVMSRPVADLVTFVWNFVIVGVNSLNQGLMAPGREEPF